jgi:hypothetical protein
METPGNGKHTSGAADSRSSKVVDLLQPYAFSSEQSDETIPRDYSHETILTRLFPRDYSPEDSQRDFPRLSTTRQPLLADLFELLRHMGKGSLLKTVLRMALKSMTDAHIAGGHARDECQQYSCRTW